MIDAVLATCATQPDFAPVSSGSGFRKREYIAATGASNPVPHVIAEANLLFGGNSKVASLISLGTGHPGIVPFPPAGSETAVHKVMRDMMEDCEQRAQEMEQRLGRVGIYSRLSVEQGLQNDCLEQTDDVGWVLAQTEYYLNRHETSEKLDLLIQNFGVQNAQITIDQLSTLALSLYLISV